MSEALKVGVIGATGAVGGEVLNLLSESSLEIGELVLVATEESVGKDVEFQGMIAPVLSEAPRLGALDLVFLCAPAAVSLEYARQALHAEVPCVDVSGALAGSREVPMRVAAFGAPGGTGPTPLIVSPPGSALALALALRPLEEAAGLRRISGTLLEAASWRGRDGIDALYRESIALFSQEDLPDPEIFGRPVAFDCIPALGEVDEETGASEREVTVADALARLLSGEPGIGLSAIQIPAFAGFGASLAIETEQPLDPALAEGVLGKAPGIERWDDEPDGATLRAAAGFQEVLVARVRRDPSAENGLQFWLAADPLRLSAANAVRLAVAALGRHH
jgi:aspartate-semialdehyde dehydrogenase